MVIFEVGSRVRNMATETVGIRSSGHCRSKRINALKQGLPAPKTGGYNVLV